MGKIRTLPDPRLRTFARIMRAADTDAEARLWRSLRAYRLGGWKWKRQVPKGSYIVDFVCEEAGLVVELDGGQHSDRVEYDPRRTLYLEGEGFRVLRFWNSAVLTNKDGVCLTILDALGGERQGWEP